MLAKQAQLVPLIENINTYKAAAPGMKTTLNQWITFLLQKTKLSLSQLCLTSPCLITHFANERTNEEFLEWFRGKKNHPHPSTLKNMTENMKKFLTFLINSTEDRFLAVKLGCVKQKWQSRLSEFNRDADRLREHNRRFSVIKDKGKYLEKKDWRSLSIKADEIMDEIELNFEEELEMDMKMAKKYTQSLLWTLGFSMGLPRTSTFTLMELNTTLVFRNGKYLIIWHSNFAR